MYAIRSYYDVPGLVIDSGTDDVHFILRIAQSFCNLVMAALYAMAETKSFNVTVFICGPCHHGIWIGVVEHDSARFCNLPNVTAEIKNGCNPTLTVHNA